MKWLSKSRFYVFIVAVFFVLIISGVPRVSASREKTIDTTYDGDIFDDTPYVRDTTSAVMQNHHLLGKRFFIEWDISSIPDTAIITDVDLRYRTYSDTVGGSNINHMVLQPSVIPNTNVGNGRIYTDSANGTTYFTTVNPVTKWTWYTRDLGTTADTDLQNNLAVNWFAIGSVAGGTNEYWSTSNNASAAQLIVTYHLPTDSEYIISNPIYENNTDAGAVTVYWTTVTNSTSQSVSTDTTIYTNEDVVTFSWGIGGGYTRYIYGIGEENFTVTLPDGNDYTYAFTIKDLTGNVGTDSFLEAYRTIDGVETLITRMPINQPNAVPMNLVIGQTYRMKIRFGDGSSFNWGYFIPGSDTSITLLIRLVTFEDGAQILYNYITVDAVRTTGLINISYADARLNTEWANVSIRIRNGAVVQTYTRNNFTYRILYAGFNDSLGYVVAFTGLHDDFGAWGRTFILDQSFTFPDAPDITGIFGDIMEDFIPTILVAITILLFPVSMQPIGLLGGGVMALMLSFFGWASWSADLLAFYWFIAIIVVLVVRGRNT